MIFVDSSGLLKLYLPEIGSLWMLQQARSEDVSISELAIAEVGVALTRSARTAVLTDEQARSAWKAFRRDVRRFRVIALSRQSLIATAMIAARQTISIRTLDAIQLRGAVEARAAARRGGETDPLLVSADTRLLRAAAALGFVTENPEDHP